MFKMRNTLNTINSILDTAEEKISKLEETAIEIIKNETQKDKRMGEKELSDIIMQPNICVVRVSKGERKMEGWNKYLKK